MFWVREMCRLDKCLVTCKLQLCCSKHTCWSQTMPQMVLSTDSLGLDKLEISFHSSEVDVSMMLHAMHCGNHSQPQYAMQ